MQEYHSIIPLEMPCQVHSQNYIPLLKFIHEPIPDKRVLLANQAKVRYLYKLREYDVVINY